MTKIIIDNRWWWVMVIWLDVTRGTSEHYPYTVSYWKWQSAIQRLIQKVGLTFNERVFRGKLVSKFTICDNNIYEVKEILFDFISYNTILCDCTVCDRT